MKIRNSIVAFLAAAPLLLGHLVEASLCSSETPVIPPDFDQSCSNSCTFGADAEETVGPGVLTSGEASSYVIAGLYFGHQNWGGCVGMVSAMASAYNGLSEEEREKVFMLAVGKFDYESLDQNFCMGFAACHDESDGSWWTTWSAAQRDVFFYIKTDPNDDNSWEFFCRYSMNVGRDEFDDTIREMLTIAATNNVPDVVEVVADVVGFEITEDDLVDGGNETSIETVGEGNETSIEMETPSLEPVGAMSDPSRSYVSAALPSATFIPSLMLVAAVLASSIV